MLECCLGSGCLLGFGDNLLGGLDEMESNSFGEIVSLRFPAFGRLTFLGRSSWPSGCSDEFLFFLCLCLFSLGRWTAP